MAEVVYLFHLNDLSYFIEMEKYNIMKISYNADASVIRPTHVAKKSEEILAIEEFINSDHENICFEYENAEEARKKRNNIATHARRDGLSVKALLRDNKVVVIRKKNTDE
jgi:hypothetical protein